MWKPLGYVLTLLLVLAAFVFFRAASVADALQILCAMAGGNSITLPYSVSVFLNDHFGIAIASVGFGELPKKILVVALLLVAFCPNSNVLIQRLQPKRKWALALAILFVCGALSLTQVTEFLYFQF